MDDELSILDGVENLDTTKLSSLIDVLTVSQEEMNLKYLTILNRLRQIREDKLKKISDQERPEIHAEICSSGS